MLLPTRAKGVRTLPNQVTGRVCQVHPQWSQERLFLATSTRCSNPVEVTTLQASSHCHQAPHLQNLGIRVDDLLRLATLQALVPVSIHALVNPATPLASTRAPDTVSLVTRLVNTQAQDMDSRDIPQDAIPDPVRASRATLILPVASIQDKADRAIPLPITQARDKVITQAVITPVNIQGATILVFRTRGAEVATIQYTIRMPRRNQVACLGSSWVAAVALEASEVGKRGTCLPPRIRFTAEFRSQRHMESRIPSRRKASNRMM